MYGVCYCEMRKLPNATVQLIVVANRSVVLRDDDDDVFVARLFNVEQQIIEKRALAFSDAEHRFGFVSSFYRKM